MPVSTAPYKWQPLGQGVSLLVLRGFLKRGEAMA